MCRKTPTRTIQQGPSGQGLQSLPPEGEQAAFLPDYSLNLSPVLLWESTRGQDQPVGITGHLCLAGHLSGPKGVDMAGPTWPICRAPICPAANGAKVGIPSISCNLHDESFLSLPRLNFHLGTLMPCRSSGDLYADRSTDQVKKTGQKWPVSG